jgi:Ca2+-binding RTX toxin-like protein
MATKTFRGVTYTEKTALTNNSSLFGTIGNDWLVTKGGNNTVFASEGKNVVLAGVTFTGIESPYDQNGFFKFSSAQASFFRSDWITYTPLANAGNMTVYSGSGDDYVITGLGNDVVFLGEGNNTFDGTGGKGLSLGSSYSETLPVLFAGNDIVYAGSGSDVIATGTGNDTVYAGEGDNKISVSDGNNRVYAGAGNDIIFSGNGNDIIFAGEGNNAIAGRGGNDVVYGGAGDDEISFEYRADPSIPQGGTPIRTDKKTIYAGEGNNSLSGDLDVSFATTNITYYGGSGRDTVALNKGGDNLFYLGEGDNYFFQTGGKATVYSGAGNDIFSLSGGNKTIYAGNGDNVFGISPSPYTGELSQIVGDNTIYLGNGANRFEFCYQGLGVTTIYGATSDEYFEIAPSSFEFGVTPDVVRIQQVGNDTLIGTDKDAAVFLLKNTIASNFTAIVYDLNS